MPLILKPLAQFEPIWSLLLISAALGVGMLWVFGRMSDQKAIRATRNRLKASLFEMRLFGDEPVLLLRAQKDLLLYNARLLLLTLRPAIIMALPLVLLVGFLEPFYGRAPLALGESAIVTLHLKQPVDANAPAPKLEVPQGVIIEAPAVRAVADGEVSWRIRPRESTTGKLRFVFPNGSVEKTIAAGPTPGYASDRRGSTWTRWLLSPSELPLASDVVESVEIRYPAAGIRWLGVELHWLVWLLLISMAVALLFKRRMGVSF